MKIQEYDEHFEELRGMKERDNANCIASYATKNECEYALAKCKAYKHLEHTKRVKDNQIKKVRIVFELEEDDRYFDYSRYDANNVATMEIYVDRHWNEERIINYVKKHMNIGADTTFDPHDIDIESGHEIYINSLKKHYGLLEE